MSEVINLSYVLTTYNKLPYLREVLDSLIKNCQDDEEIIITDGASSDGTQEYLQKLYEEGRIHQYISERDFGEAHGFNKGILLARGELIKIITDDDVFDFEVIKQCRKYLFSNKKVDVLFGNILSITASKETGDLTFAKSYEVWYRDWEKGLIKNCFMCGLSFFIRKQTLSNIGLFDTSFKHIDLEYSVRITSKKVNVVFYTALMVTAVINVNSISYNEGDVVNKEIKRVSDYYDYTYPIGIKPPKPNVINHSLAARILAKFKTETSVAEEYYADFNYLLKKDLDTSDIQFLYKTLASIMEEYNRENKPEFIENIRY